MIDLETLILGISGKIRLWVLLDELIDGETGADLADLIRRAEGQRATVESLQARAARLL